MINWYPGHMNKTFREIKEKIKLIDIVIEILDSRIPLSSKNIELNKIINTKPKLIILNKMSFADKEKIDAYIKNNKNDIILPLDLKELKSTQIIDTYIQKVAKNIYKKREEKGINLKDLKIMVVGIPNVGKSTFINKVANKSSLVVKNKPGVTRNTSMWLKCLDKYLLLDTPGMLWPKIENIEQGYKLVICGSISLNIIHNIDDIIYYLIKYLKDNYAKCLIKRYKIENLDTISIIIDQIARNRGCIKKGGILDYDKAYEIILNDAKNGLIGEICYDFN